MNRFVLVDPSRCIGCRTCEVSCVLSHAGGCISNIDPDNFHARVNVVKENDISAATTCRHCEDAPCAAACPNGAIIRAEDSVQVLQEKCVGCRSCVLACPGGAMTVRLNKVPRVFGGQTVGFSYKAQAQKCDLCANSAKGSACVAACPTNALRLVSNDEIIGCTGSHLAAAAMSKREGVQNEKSN